MFLLSSVSRGSLLTLVLHVVTLPVFTVHVATTTEGIDTLGLFEITVKFELTIVDIMVVTGVTAAEVALLPLLWLLLATVSVLGETVVVDAADTVDVTFEDDDVAVLVPDELEPDTIVVDDVVVTEAEEVADMVGSEGGSRLCCTVVFCCCSLCNRVVTPTFKKYVNQTTEIFEINSN